MFYFLSTKLPLISTDKNTSSKLFKTFVVGSIAYIALHAYIFNAKNSENEFIVKYRKYLYYLWGADLTAAAIFVKFFGPKEEEVLEEEVEDKQEFLNREEILRRMQAQQMMQQMIQQRNAQLAQLQPSPFITKEEVAKQVKKPKLKQKVESISSSSSNDSESSEESSKISSESEKKQPPTQKSSKKPTKKEKTEKRKLSSSKNEKNDKKTTTEESDTDIDILEDEN